MTLAHNKKARMLYKIEETFEAGLVLTGAEIKAIRNHRASLDGTFARIQNGEAWVLNMHIANTPDPERTRKLLLHQSEIQSLIGKTAQKNYTLVPLKLYLKKGKAKLEIGLGRGKKLYDHREELKKRDLRRQIERDLKE